jgi:hypothetical protein
VSDLVSAVRSTMGRYFSLVSAVPSAALVLFAFLLVRSGAWTSAPDWAGAFAALTEAGAGTWIVLGVTALAFGLLLHPLQFPLVQLYEGYWGATEIGRRLWLDRTLRHRTRAVTIRDAGQFLGYHLGRSDTSTPPEKFLWMSGLRVATQRVDAGYPHDVPIDDGDGTEDGAAVDKWDPFMPTRLGNVLRRYEMTAGAPYGIDAVQAVPYLALVAAERDVAYLDEQRETLDMVVRLSAMSLLACGLAGVFLWDDGLWLLIALIPYGLAYAFYRGAVAVAHEYGTAIAMLIALNREALYARLRLAAPPDAEAERTRNGESLSYLLALDPDAPAVFQDTIASQHAVQLDVALAEDRPVPPAVRRAGGAGHGAGP